MDHEFETSLGYVMKLCPKLKKKKENWKREKKQPKYQAIEKWASCIKCGFMYVLQIHADTL